MTNPNFPALAQAINFRLEKQIADQELFLSKVTQEEIWDLYLSSFPEGTNEIFRERTSHDCNCCKQFIRQFGRTVTIKDGVKDTIWNVKNLPEPYATVAAALHEKLVSSGIQHIWRTKENQFGSEVTRSMSEEHGLEVWNHFWGHVNKRHRTANVGPIIGEAISSVGVFKRGLEELTLSSVNDVLDLITAKNLYRGEEFKTALTGFKTLKLNYSKAKDKEAFLWENWKAAGARIRNSVIGSLLIDLSEGKTLDQAVNSYEKKVAGDNYKRPKALITPRMVEMAQKELEKEGLENAIYRRYARIEDISVNNVLFVDSIEKKLMQGGLMDLLADQVKLPEPKLNQEVISVSSDEFLKEVLPKTSKLSVYLRNAHQNNLVSLTAPAEAREMNRGLFKWDNDFAWSYNGNVADSIKERVKAAGGNIQAPFRVSLAWFNTDDLDLSMQEPDGNNIYFGAKRSTRSTGFLDVDMNVSRPVRNAVENIAYRSIPKDGAYKVYVNNYNRREQVDKGFTLQLEFQGEIREYSFNRGVEKHMPMLGIHIKKGKLEKVELLDKRLESTSAGKDVWGVRTETLTRVSSVMLSPNHWDGKKEGLRHVFFMLDGCKNPNSTRGLYNEFLSGKFEKHRKVFEVLGDKTKCPYSDDQLSGIGFTEARDQKVVLVAQGPKFNRTYEVSF